MRSAGRTYDPICAPAFLACLLLFLFTPTALTTLDGEAAISLVATDRLRAESFQGLEDLPDGEIGSWANGVSADGSVVVGSSKIEHPDQLWSAFVWDAEHGMRSNRFQRITTRRTRGTIVCDSPTPQWPSTCRR